MRTYIISRLLLAIPTLFGVSVVAFLTINLIPGNIVEVMLGTRTDVTPQQIAELNSLYGLSTPLWQQYLIWAGHIVHADLGFSLRTGLPVATLLILAVSIYLPWLSSFTFVPFLQNPARNVQTMILPACTLGLGLAAIIMRMTRAAMLEVLRKDYLRTARAKGLGRARVLAKHALRNALLPVITIVGLQIGYLVGGAVIVENVFTLPGVGRLVVQAIEQRDYPLVQSVVFAVAALVILVNLLVDLSYAWV